MIRKRVQSFVLYALIGACLVGAATTAVAMTMPEEARYWVRRFRSRQAKRHIDIGPRRFDVSLTASGELSVQVDGATVVASNVEDLERHLLRLLIQSDNPSAGQQG